MDQLRLVPWPAKVLREKGTVQLDARTRIIVDAGVAEASAVARQLADRLNQSSGLAIKTGEGGPGMTIALRRNDANLDLGPEGYVLTVDESGVVIAAPAGAGLFYGMETFLQLLPPKNQAAKQRGEVASVEVPAVRIEDQPRFAWRGLMLDCSRTFQSLDYLRQTIDRLATCKMNVLHLHLTDDQGWRIEIRKHPELTLKGARFSARYKEPASHQGFYTQDQLRELVRYAATRNVTIIPEIEMPGHSHEVVVCRPDLSCSGQAEDDIFPYDFTGRDPSRCITSDILCAGNEATFKFMEEVLDEVMEVFPSKFIHIGGDEAPKDCWKACAKCQARMKAERLKDELELQSYFIRRIERHINAKGRQVIGWSEILQGGLAPNAAVMDWIGGADAATKTGHDAVMSPQSHCYFDHPCKEISAEKAYSFEPCVGLVAEQAKHILGLQANFWSHIDREPELVDRQLFPRLLSLAERGWSPEGVRDWAAFKVRLDAQLPRLRAMGIHYNREPFVRWSPQQLTETYQPLVCDVTSQIGGPGRFQVRFQYTGGACRLGMESVELLANGAAVSADRHRGMTGATDEGNTYIIELNQHVPGTKYELRASVRGEGGIDSYGDAIMEENPS